MVNVMNTEQIFKSAEQYMLKAFYRFHATPHAACDDAPDTWQALQEWASSHKLGRDPLPVFSGGCEHTIYTCPENNITFRAWHDTIHLRHGLDFSRDGELTAAKEHYRELLAIGAPFEVRYTILADTAGQFLYHEKHGQHVINQRRFVDACLHHGIETVINSGIQF